MGKKNAKNEMEKPDGKTVNLLLESLAVLSDPREDKGKRYPLTEVLAIAVLGCVCGCDDAESLEDWGRKEKPWLARILPLRHGTPGQDVFLRVLAALEPQPFQAAFLHWVRSWFGSLGMDVQLAIDGQTSRGSRKGDKGPVHMVSALTCGRGVVLGQVKTSEKSNEITAIPELLKLLALRGALVSIDAMGCQVAIANQIQSKRGDYLLGLKGNQSTLHDEVIAAFAAASNPSSINRDQARPPSVIEATEVDKGHGRLETRTAQVMPFCGDWVPAGKRWPGLSTLIRIQSEVENLQSGKTTTEERYYICSRVLDAEQANTLIRGFQGDRYSVPRRRRLCDYDLAYRERLLGL